MWKTNQPASLNRDSLAALFANEIPAIRISQFADAQECSRFAEATQRFTMKPVMGDTAVGRAAMVAQRIDHLGLTQAVYKSRGPDVYFTDSKQAAANTAEVYALSFNPLERLLGLLSSASGGDVSFATEPDGRSYFVGIIRKSNSGLALHADFAPYQAPGYYVDRVEAQLAWNFYAETPAEGGVTTLHDAPWTWSRSQPGEVAENYPLPAEAVAGASTFSYQPRAGEAWLFNSRNPHVVSPPAEGADRDRLAVACFVGRLPENRIVLWS
jgi:hypothetical protein